MSIISSSPDNHIYFLFQDLVHQQPYRAYFPPHQGNVEKYKRLWVQHHGAIDEYPSSKSILFTNAPDITAKSQFRSFNRNFITDSIQRTQLQRLAQYEFKGQPNPTTDDKGETEPKRTETSSATRTGRGIKRSRKSYESKKVKPHQLANGSTAEIDSETVYKSVVESFSQCKQEETEEQIIVEGNVPAAASKQPKSGKQRKHEIIHILSESEDGEEGVIYIDSTASNRSSRPKVPDKPKHKPKLVLKLPLALIAAEANRQREAMSTHSELTNYQNSSQGNNVKSNTVPKPPPIKKKMPPLRPDELDLLSDLLLAHIRKAPTRRDALSIFVFREISSQFPGRSERNLRKHAHRHLLDSGAVAQALRSKFGNQRADTPKKRVENGEYGAPVVVRSSGSRPEVYVEVISSTQ